MNELEQKMTDILVMLKEYYCLNGVKIEFEAEGASFDDAKVLKSISDDILLAVKIGGCEAVKDLCDAKKLGAKCIVAPMIETSYALKKFIKAINNVYTEVDDTKFFINIETITGYNNIDEIINCEEFGYISGVVLGRDDMAGSMNLSKDDVNSIKILDIAKDLSKKMKLKRKDFIIGGSISFEALSFLNEIDYLTKIETRKIIFDKEVLLNKNVKTAIMKAIEFEYFWLKNKNNLLSYDKKRLELFDKRLKIMKEELSLLPI